MASREVKLPTDQALALLQNPIPLESSLRSPGVFSLPTWERIIVFNDISSTLEDDD